MSASPQLMAGYWTMLQRVTQHPRLYRALLALIRLGVSMESAFPYCVELNSVSLLNRCARLRAKRAVDDVDGGVGDAGSSAHTFLFVSLNQ